MTLLLVLVASVMPPARAVRAETPPAQADDVITHIDFVVKDDHPNGFDWADLARTLVRLAPGDPFNAEKLQNAEMRLIPFAEVQTRITPEPGGQHLTFILMPFKRIKSIDIKGAYPLFEKDVRRVMTVAAGDIFHPEQMPEQETLIRQRYRDEGYVDPEVTIQWEADEDDGHFLVRVDIVKGPYYTLEKVVIRGNEAIGDDDLLSRMSTWRTSTFMFGLGRFVEKDFKEDVSHLIEYYRSERFAQATITPSITYDAPHQRVRCELVVSEGPQYRVQFKGNDFLSEFSLRKSLEIYTSGNVANIGLRRSIQNIRREYLSQGFVDVKVGWTETASHNHIGKQLGITIDISEGRRHIVDGVLIQGNVHFDDDTVMLQMLTIPRQGTRAGPYVKDTLAEDVAAIAALYQMSGFLNVAVSDTVQIDPDSARVKVIITIEEGLQTKVGHIELKGDSPISSNELLRDLTLSPGREYNPTRLQADENQLAAMISEQGFPHVTVKADVLMSEDQANANIVYNIDTGPQVRVGRIFLLGNFRTRNRFLDRQIKFKSGELFSLKKVLDAQRNLRDLDVFDSVQVRTDGLKRRSELVHLLVTVIERRPYYLEVAGGYQTDKGLYGRFKIGDRNFLGTVNDVSTNLEVSEVGYLWDVSIADPRFLGTDITARAGLYTEVSEPFNQDIGTETAGSDVKFYRLWGRYASTTLAARYERRQQFLRNQEAAEEYEDSNAFDPRTLVVVTPTIQYDTRDSFIRPKKGEWLSLSVDISYGLDSNDFDNFTKYRLDLRYYYSLFSNMVIACRVGGGFILQDTAEPPLQDQLLVLGGGSTVRGFGENLLRYDEDRNAVGGRAAYTGSLEARIHIGGKFELIPFVDTGSVQDAVVDAGSDAFRWAAGLGVGYITAIGPVGLFYGHKLDPLPEESDGQWHLAIGYSF